MDVRSFVTAATALRAGHAEATAPTVVPELLRWLLAEQIRWLRADGVEPLFVIAPVTTGEEELRRLPERGVVRTLLAFNDPAAYPDLYEVDARADTMHLNERGALRFTQLLAERFASCQAAPAARTP